MGTNENSSGAPANVNSNTNNNNNNHNHRNSSGNSSSCSSSGSSSTGNEKQLQQVKNENQQQQQQQQQQQFAQLPKASPPPQVITIPTTQASIVATNAAKKIRRAFTMPRNPFRWSRKFKTSTAGALEEECSSPGGSNPAITSCVGGGRGRAGSIVSVKSYEAINKDAMTKIKDGQGQGGLGDCDNHCERGTARNSTQQQNGDEINDDKIERKIGGKQNRNSTSVAARAGAGDNTNATAAAAASSSNRIFRRSSFRKFLNRIAQHVSNTVNIGSMTTTNDKTSSNYMQDMFTLYTGCWRRQDVKKANKQTMSLHHQHNNVIPNTDRVPPIGYQWPSDQTPGVMGLKNHGNTCFMNAVLQCLSHTDILAEYFVLDQYKADLKRRNKINSRKFGTKGELTEQLANVLKALWMCKNESDHSTSFKAVVDRYGSQFRSSTQHDAQEFLFWLLDKVHEDLNTATKRKYKSVKNSYGRPDEVIAAETLANHIRCNNSFVQAVFQAQFRSSLTCPRCKKQSNTFDPFHCISVQLPQLLQQNIFVTVVYLKQQPRQVKLGLRIPAGSPIIALREQLQTDTGIASDCIVLVDINKEGFTRVFYDTQPIETLLDIETIFCIEVPKANDTNNGNTESENGKTASAAANKTMATTTITTISSTTIAATSTNTNTTASATVSGCVSGSSANNQQSTELLLLVANVRKKTKIKELTAAAAAAAGSVVDNENKPKPSEKETILERFGIPFSMRAPRDCSYVELQKKLLNEMSSILKPSVASCSKDSKDMFQIRLQCPSADPDSYLEPVEHPLLTEMIDMALSVLTAESGPAHIKLLLEWPDPEKYFDDLSDTLVEHESVGRLRDNKKQETQALSLEQCLEHYTKAETLSAEDAWRCPHCQQYLPVVKTLGLWSLPDILVVHFKRFRQHQEKGQNAAKLTTMVKFPLNAFDMSPHLAQGARENSSNGNGNGNGNGVNLSTFENYRPSPWRKSSNRPGDSRSSTLNSRDNKETRYDLYAVCYHQGDTLETGHYTAACKNPYDQQWYKFDDQRVSKVPNESIEEEIINNEAYMLFYQRRNENGECSGSSGSNSGGDHWVSRLPPPPGAIPIPVVEKFTATVENIIQPKAEETNLLEEPTVESAEIRPTVILSSGADDDSMPEKLQEACITSVAVKELQIEVEINNLNEEKKVQSQNIIDTEKIDFADADADADADDDADHHLDNKIPSIIDNDETANEKSLLTISLNREINSIQTNAKAAAASAAAAAQTTLPLNLVQDTSSINKIEAISSSTNGQSDGPASAAVKVNGLTNGFKLAREENGVVVLSCPTTKASNGSSCSASASSSLSSSSSSSLSSPRELSTSINGATSLQTKFNGFASSTYASTINSHKEAFLSSSLKSNSSSVIGTHALAASHHQNHHHPSQQQQQQLQEFHLSRYQHQNWNGSRFSVSAVENATIVNSSNAPHAGLNLRHSFSTSSNYKLRECNETLSSLLRNSANTCSKDTLLILDQQTHHHHHHHHHHPNSLLEDDDDNFMDSRSLWISPVTPHKLITVSPKN